MADHSELKRLAEACAAAGEYSPGDAWDEDRSYGPAEVAFLAFAPAATPMTVLALIADLEEARNGMKHSCAIRLKKEIERLEGERDQLRAEVAGLKTGYEAYERVNAELKAEVEELRKYGEEFAVLAERRREEADALRKDSESYRLLSFCHGQGTLELVRSHHELCAEIRRLKILAGEPVPPTPEEFIGPSPEGPTARIRRKLAAMGKGEQP